MGTKYTTTPITGYNNSPPVDDGTQSEANKVKWSTHKTKLGDPLKDQIASIDTKLVAMADIGPDAKTANYTTVAGDHQKTIEVSTSSITITLLLVASAPAGYSLTIKNSSGGTINVQPSTGEKIDGSTGIIMLANDEVLIVQLNQAKTEYIVLQQPDNTIISAAQVYKGTAAGTADVITASLTPTLSALTDGTVCFVKAFLSNTTTTPTFNPDGLGAKTITKEGSQPLVAGDIARVDHELILRYNSANAEWELLNPSISYPKDIQSITGTVAANALTVGLNPNLLAFRDSALTDGTPTILNVNSALSLVVPSGATLGTINAVQSRLILLAINNAGTVELAIVNQSGGNNLDETTLISTTAIDATADLDNVIYSTTARTNVPFRVVGYIESTQATAGTWATAPTILQGAGGNALTAMNSIGNGQTWQNVVGSRAKDTLYYNTTGKPIMVALNYIKSSLSTRANIVVDGVALPEARDDSTISTNQFMCAIVPPGSSYELNSVVNTVSILEWVELR